MLVLLGFANDSVSPIEIISLLWYQALLGFFTIIYIFVPKISELTLKIVDRKNKKDEKI